MRIYHIARELYIMHCDDLNGDEVQSGGGDIYVWLVHFAVHWILTQHHKATAAAAAKSLRSCPTLCNPIDGSPPGSTIPGILQARTLEWVAISFSNAWKWKVKVKSLSCVWLFKTPWTAACQAPLSMGFSRQECWSGVPLPSPIKQLYNNKNYFFKKRRISVQ